MQAHAMDRRDWRMMWLTTRPKEIQTLIDNHINGFNTQNI